MINVQRYRLLLADTIFMEKKLELTNKLTVAPSNLLDFFIEHLNMVYCAKAHLVERLPEIATLADFSDLRYAVEETSEDVFKQMARMEEIFTLLDTSFSLENCDGLINFVELSFSAIHLKSSDHALRDMAILYYLQNMESLEMASFQILMLIATGFKNKQISHLLKQNFDEAKADRALMLLITARYLAV